MKEMAPASVRYVLADQLLRPVLPLLACAMTQILAAVRLRVLELRRQPAEIRGRGGSIIGLGHWRGMRFGLRVRTFEMPLKRRKYVPESARHNPLVRLNIVAGFFTCKRAKEILPADDSDHLPVPHHRHALDPMSSKQAHDLAGISVFADGDDRARHDV